MERQKTRMAEISALNVFLCMLVIFIHVSSAPVTAYEKSSWQFCVVFLLWRYAGFAVQGFIFLGGLRFFYSKRDGISYRSFYLQRLVKIVVPYIAWSVVYYLCFIYKGYFSFSVRDLALYLLRGNIIAPFYFVITIIQFYALAPLWRFVVRRVNVAAALIVSAVITIILSQYLPSLIDAVFRDSGFRYTDRVFTTYLFYWLAGCYAGMYYEQAKNFVKKMRTLIALIFVMLLLSEGILGYISNAGIIHISWLEYVHFLYCIGAILFFFMLFITIFENRPIKIKAIIETDRAAYLIFLTHCLAILAVNTAMELLGIKSISLSYVIRIITVYPVTIIGCVLYHRAKSCALLRLAQKSQDLT